MQEQREPFLAKLISERTFGLAIAMTVFVSLSLMAWFKIPLEVMPRESTPPFLYVYVNSPQPAAPEKIELFLTLPVEGALRTVSNLMSLTAQSTGRGASFSLTLKPKTNLDLATLQVQEALQDLESAGILDMRGVSISRMNPEASAVAKISVTYGAQVKSPFARIQEELREAIEAVPEISKVEIMGLEPTLFEYRIPVARAQDAGVSTGSLSSALSFSPIRESLGLVHRVQLSLPVQARMIVDDLETIKRVNLSQSSIVPLAGLGEEHRIDKAASEISHNNGRHAVFLEIYSKESANLFNMTEHLESTLKKFKDLDFEVVFNKTDDLQSALHEVLASLYQAIAITFFVVFFFLRNGRKTALICVTIPITLLATVLVLYIAGDTLNILTLSGLILGIGMVVDNAVLVTGMIDELKSKYGIKKAAGHGASRVFMALLMSTVTNAIIFLPVSFIEGGDSFTDILKAFQLPIVASLCVSLVIALLLLPLLIISWPGKKAAAGEGGHESTHVNPSVVRFFIWTRRHRLPIALAAFLFVGVVAESAMQIEQSDIGSPKDPYTTINVKFSPESDSDERRDYFDLLEKKVITERGKIGYRFVVSEFNPKFTSGTLSVYPFRSDDMDADLDRQEKNLKALLQTLPKKAGVSAKVGFEGGASSGTSTRYPEIYAVTGPRSLAIQSILRDLKDNIFAMPGVEAVRLDREEQGETNLFFVTDDAIVSQYGLTLSAIAKEISSAMTSVSVSNLRYNGQPVAARIALGPLSGEWTLDSLKALRIAVGGKGAVSIGDLGHFTTDKVLTSISRKEGVATGKLYVDFKADLPESDLQKAKSAVRKYYSNFNFPKGYGPPKSDSQERIQEMAKKGQFIIYLSVILIYLVLASMFESILIPFSILFSIPLALLFGISGLLVMGLDLDVMARLSLVILVGIAVNNAIILIDIIQELKAQGLRRGEAVVQGCARRLKAVLMTTSIQVIGVLPVAMGKAKIMGIPYSSLGVSIISGMLFSTLLTLIILPMVYEFLDDIENKLKSFASSLRG